MSESYKKLIKTLQSMFEMDKADLDFGIYRIMNQKRDEINRFLEDDLLPQVKNAFANVGNDSRTDLQRQLTAEIDQARKYGAPDPENSPAVLEIKKKLENAVDVTALENEVFSKLQTFFSRYYDKGDFISQRRYKADTYAIPYEGEEVKLYWANHDQYYIKSSEHLKDYAFLASPDKKSEKAFRIRLVEADTEKDNVKAKEGEERRFVIDQDNPLQLTKGELLINFQFIPAGKKKQSALNDEAVKTIFAVDDTEYLDWLALLKTPASTAKNKDRTLLEKHLNDYTARNSFDYFIHKDLTGFLFRELDFFIKNEVIHLDDLNEATFELTQTQLNKAKIIKEIASKIVRMLSQIENFQKKMWLKKKFIYDVSYCISLMKTPYFLVQEAIENIEQLDEWVESYKLDKEDLKREFENLGPERLVAESKYRFLVLDTKFFTPAFTNKLLMSFDDIDQELDGEVINADNFHGLSIFSKKYEKKVKYSYIDVPYNTNSTPILYKNEFKDSSWMSLIANRLQLAKNLMSSDGITTIAIDDAEVTNLSGIISQLFQHHRVTRITVVHNPKGSITKDFNRVHEYAIFITPEDAKQSISRTLEENKTPRKMRRWGENSLRTDRRLSFYPIYVKDGEVVDVGEMPSDDFHPSGRNIKTENGRVEVWPIDQNGIERRWNFGLDSILQNLDRVTALEVDGTIDLFVTHELTVPKTVWKGGEYDAGKYGNSLLIDILGEKRFDFPKSLYTVKNSIRLTTKPNERDIVLDYFAGSGTTAHAVLELNKEDEGNRKFLLVEMGKHFDTVVIPRIKKVAYCEKWSGGIPNTDDYDGQPIFFKYFRLEGYEDALSNLLVKKAESGSAQSSLLSSNSELYEDYILNYWTDLELKGDSLINIDRLDSPFDYKLKLSSDSAGGLQYKNVDLPSTFNYLIGLKTKTYDYMADVLLITGSDSKGNNILVVWRFTSRIDNSELESILSKKGVSTKDNEFDIIYVNGDNTLDDPHSKVMLIEAEFKRLMFETELV